jgi:hypothetical protein
MGYLCNFSKAVQSEQLLKIRKFAQSLHPGLNKTKAASAGMNGFVMDIFVSQDRALSSVPNKTQFPNLQSPI